MRGIQAAGNAKYDALEPNCLQPLHQTGNLNVVTLVAILLQPGRISRYEWKPFDNAVQSKILFRRIKAKLYGAESTRGRCMGTAVIVESPHPNALLTEKIQIDIRGDVSAGRWETLRLRL